MSETPVAAGVESAGIFSIAFRDKDHGMIVGGDYRKPNDIGATAAATADGGKTWTPLDKRLPFRSAVAWAKDRWVAVGTSGSHVSRTTARPGSCSTGRITTASGSPRPAKAGRWARKVESRSLRSDLAQRPLR